MIVSPALERVLKLRRRKTLKFIDGAACILVLIMSGVGSAADPVVFSGLQPGERLPASPVVLAYGARRGGEIDLVRTADGKATMLIFVQGANRPAARLTRVGFGWITDHQNRNYRLITQKHRNRRALA